jgi:hypothetical protein
MRVNALVARQRESHSALANPLLPEIRVHGTDPF